MNSLFGNAETPLWTKLRPRDMQSYHDFAGLTALRDEFQKKPFSFLLYGPPGIGKTTFIELLLKEASLPFVSLPAASTSLEEIRKSIDKNPGATILFLDEFHRFAKSRQDYFLKPIEEGRIILIAATTESPWYYITRPLLSRMRVREIKAPQLDQFLDILQTTWQNASLPEIDDLIWQKTIERVYPDFRSAILALEALLPFLETDDKQNLVEKLDHYFQENRQSLKNFTAKEYDLLSAFIKSVRGSDPDSSILYLAKLLQMGVDPTIPARRLLILASEDIGLANSQALLVAQAAAWAVENTGMPEARIPLAHATIYLAASPKSNAAYNAINAAMKFCEKNEIVPPGHIMNNSPQIKDYKYPHDFQGWVDQNYWAVDVERQNFYKPEKGVFPESKESKLKEIFERLWSHAPLD
ncbi:MAG: AAA family ATPase [Leptospiraceae bacterium]|nr:AAA family ATPase [Leptospiraceae bacterium]